jgi:hypothetical protein
VPSSREPRLLQEYPSERVGGVVADRIACRLASAHGGVEARQDVGEGGHSFFAQRAFPAASGALPFLFERYILSVPTLGLLRSRTRGLLTYSTAHPDAL